MTHEGYAPFEGEGRRVGGASTASEVPIVDTANQFIATDVEAALAEVKNIADTAAGGGVTLEQVQDDLGLTSLLAGTSLTKIYDDVANTITLNVDAADFDPAGSAAAAQAASQPLSAVLTATTASFLVADETKLDGIEALADVTDTANVTAAGALMDSEVTSLAAIKNLVVPLATTISAFGATLTDDLDAAAARTTLGLGNAATLTVDADIATLAVPASTTISAYGATLVDDLDAATARTTLGLGTMATQAAASYLPLLAAGAAVENVGSIEENVEVASVATTKAFDAAVYGRAVYTMTGNTTFSVTNPAPAGKATTFAIRIKGAFTPTLPASFDFAGTPPAYVGTGEGTTYVGTTEDGGTTYQVTVLAGWA